MEPDADRRRLATIPSGIVIKALFHEQGYLSEWLRFRGAQAQEAVEQFSPDTVLSTPEPDVLERLLEQFEVTPLHLHADKRHIVGGVQDSRVDVSRDPLRAVDDRSRPALVPGTRIDLAIPFDGEPELFDLRPNTFTTRCPRGEVRGREVVIRFEAPSDVLEAERVKQQLDADFTDLLQWVGFSSSECEQFNVNLRPAIKASLSRRRQKVLSDRNLEAYLQIPVLRRSDASPILAMPVPKRRPVLVQPAGRSFTPDPGISSEDYAAILGAIRAWAAAVERQPRSSSAMDEEAHRNVLLMVLNNQFGASGGEMFSGNGKTDILIQQGPGAVFIAECKFWAGSKGFDEALEQLLGYLVWRDTKSALILLIREKDVTAVCQKAQARIRSHKRFKRTQQVGGGEVFTLHHEDDTNREIEVGLIFVPVPTAERDKPVQIRPRRRSANSGPQT
jgi:hypothetical protein